MRFKVLTATPVHDTTYGGEFDYEPGAPSNQADPTSQPFDWKHWVDLGLVQITQGEPPPDPSDVDPPVGAGTEGA